MDFLPLLHAATPCGVHRIHICMSGKLHACKTICRAMKKTGRKGTERNGKTTSTKMPPTGQSELRCDSGGDGQTEIG